MIGGAFLRSRDSREDANRKRGMGKYLIDRELMVYFVDLRHTETASNYWEMSVRDENVAPFPCNDCHT